MRASLLTVILLLVHLSLSATIDKKEREKIGIGVITNKRTRASETFKLYEIFNNLDFKNGSGKKMDIVYADNASVAGIYLTGEIEHYRLTEPEQAARRGNMLVIDEGKHGGWAYMTKIRLQVWKDQRFEYLFSDSVLYFPTNDDTNTPQYNVINSPELYDESFELLSPLLLDLFKNLENKYQVGVSGLKNGKIFKYDVKAHVVGSPIDLNKFLSPHHSSVIGGAYGSGSFNEYFENKFTTVSNKELFFVGKYGGRDMRTVIGKIAYPKTCWKEAVTAYINLGDNFYADKDLEGFAVANWSALILANQMKEKITDIFTLKKKALQNLSLYAQKASQPDFNSLLQLNIALIDGLLSSGITRESEKKYDVLMAELEKTFAASQDAMDDLRRKERGNVVIKALSFATVLASAANDGKNGLNTSSATTDALLKDHTGLASSLDDHLSSSQSYFRSHFSDIDFDIPVTFLQPEGDDKIDFNKAILYLECMKLIYADKNNQYWQKCFEKFRVNDPGILNAYTAVINAPANGRTNALINLSKALSKFERNSFLTEKLNSHEKN